MAGIAALAAAYVLSQFYRTFLAVLTPVLSVELGASNALLSVASGTWFALFALMQFIIGIWLDRYGPRRTASLLLGVCASLGAVILTLATAPWMIVVSMGLIGIGCSPILMASVYIFAKSYPSSRLSVLSSWLMATGMMGSVLGTAPLASVAANFGWRPVLLVIAGLTVLSSIALYALVQDPVHTETEGKSTGFFGYLELLRVRALWPIIPMIMIATIPSQAIRGLWAGPYLADVFSADVILIGNVTFFMAIALVLGSFVYGPLDTILGTRKWIVAGGMVVTMACLSFLAMFPHSPLIMITSVMILIGFCGGCYGPIIAHAKSFMPAHLTGRGVTLMNFFSIGSVGMMQFLSGGIYLNWLDAQRPELAYQAVFIFFALALLVGFIIYLFSKDAPPLKG